MRTEGKNYPFSVGKPVVTEQGELQLTDYGVSGIPVFQISRYAVRNIKEGRDAEIIIDFMPELSADEFRELLLKRKRTCPYKNDRELLIGLFPEKLIRIFCRTEGSGEGGQKPDPYSNRQSFFCPGPGMFRRGGYQGDSFPYYGIT